MITQTQHDKHAVIPSIPLQSPLKYQRLLRGWSQQDVVDALYQCCVEEGKASVGINVDQVSRWENGHCKPSPMYRKHLCYLYGVTADKLGLISSQEVQA
ncbi:hypothetical protein KDW_30500 [Dictyobacter vulcani]|uniref:HTH cro/C1-type domain-containing protein n=1 Tax=Dictyobacter vulcani TaxID=2607529 RepID=A0A5J4KGT5_9CHLR|nr:helix-turn-helix transcriptional regulator [Dictyobacter vulcani]GER88888.1 hypothetical protein KDW_30500 [Dictyobacter vulcani]